MIIQSFQALVIMVAKYSSVSIEQDTSLQQSQNSSNETIPSATWVSQRDMNYLQACSGVSFFWMTSGCMLTSQSLATSSRVTQPSLLTSSLSQACLIMPTLAGLRSPLRTRMNSSKDTLPLPSRSNLARRALACSQLRWTPKSLRPYMSSVTSICLFLLSSIILKTRPSPRMAIDPRLKRAALMSAMIASASYSYCSTAPLVKGSLDSSIVQQFWVGTDLCVFSLT